MSPHIFVLLLEGKANLKGCGTVTMPSAEAMAEANPDIKKRAQAIRKVDMSGMENLEGECSIQYIILMRAVHCQCDTPFSIISHV